MLGEDIAATKAQEARDQAEQARTQANQSLGASADALGRATAAADQAAATRDAALRTYAAANDTVAMGSPFAQTDTSAGMAVLVGQDAKTIAEQQTAAADAKAAEATQAAQAAHDAATHAATDAKAAADAAAAAADDATTAQNSVIAAAASAKRAAQEASLTAASVARTAQYNANAQAAAAHAARYAAEAHAEAQAASDAADAAERDAAAAHAAADQATAAAADARDAAEQAEKDAAAAEAAAQRALEAAQDAQNAAALAEKNADADARDALNVSSPFGETGIQEIPHVEPQIISHTNIVCPLLSGERFCKTDVTFRMVGTKDIVLVTCPDPAQTSCPGHESTDLLSTIEVNEPPQTQTVRLYRGQVLEFLRAVVTSLTSDYINCFKGIFPSFTGADQPKDWGIACAWVAADWIVPAGVGKIAKAVKAVRIAMRTGTGLREAYDGLKASGVSASALARIRADMIDAVARLCGGGNSFTADTLVLMANGETKPISQVVAGDRVRTTDPGAGQALTETVERQLVNEDTDLADVTVRDSHGGTAVVHTTQHHLFWVDGDATSWVPAGALRPGDQLRTDRSAAALVGSVRSFTNAETMYDLTVANVHTFYVVVGDVPVLVHNRSCPAWVGGVIEALKTRKLTTGILFKRETLSGSRSPVVLKGATESGGDGVSANIDAFLKQSPDIDPLLPGMKEYPSITHADTKLAWWMRENYDTVKEADMVINNEDGPCDFRFGCIQAIRAILYEGQSVEIFFPEATEGITVEGAARRPAGGVN